MKLMKIKFLNRKCTQPILFNLYNNIIMVNNETLLASLTTAYSPIAGSVLTLRYAYFNSCITSPRKCNCTRFDTAIIVPGSCSRFILLIR